MLVRIELGLTTKENVCSIGYIKKKNGQTLLGCTTLTNYKKPFGEKVRESINGWQGRV